MQNNLTYSPWKHFLSRNLFTLIGGLVIFVAIILLYIFLLWQC
jgi:hypothetical protein